MGSEMCIRDRIRTGRLRLRRPPRRRLRVPPQTHAPRRPDLRSAHCRSRRFSPVAISHPARRRPDGPTTSADVHRHVDVVEPHTTRARGTRRARPRPLQPRNCDRSRRRGNNRPHPRQARPHEAPSARPSPSRDIRLRARTDPSSLLTDRRHRWMQSHRQKAADARQVEQSLARSIVRPLPSSCSRRGGCDAVAPFGPERPAGTHVQGVAQGDPRGRHSDRST